MGHVVLVEIRKVWINVIIYEPARKEILSWPLEVKKDLGSILTKIQMGISVGAPDTKPMRTVTPGCFEIRLKGKDGIFRAFYVVKTDVGILLFHSFKKKTQKTPQQELDTGRSRLKAQLKEIENEKD